MKRGISVLGFFPDYSSTSGGVQASGREAWRTVLSHVGSERARLLSHDATGSKLRAAMGAAAAGRADLVLVWHLGLLKLLPFADPSLSRGVVFLHGIESWKRLDPITLRLLRRSRLVLTNSDYTWSRFVSANPSCAGSRHRTVHLGLGTLAEGSLPPARRPSAVMIGRLEASEAYKGHHEVIRAWSAVLSRYPHAELVIAGEGNLRPELEALVASLGLAGSVRFAGLVSEEEKLRMLMDARCLALPSLGEGFGLVYLEAMRVGRPCLVSTVDAGREVVRPPEAGLAVDPLNSPQVAEALCQLLSDGDQWYDLSRRARKRYEEQFTAAAFHGRLARALEESGLLKSVHSAEAVD